MYPPIILNMFNEGLIEENMKINRSVSLEFDLWKKLDELKGDVPRSKFLSKIIVNGLKVLENRT